MQLIDKLRFSALRSAKFRGHNMRRFNYIHEATHDNQTGRILKEQRIWGRSKCKNCGMEVYIDIQPPPNGIDIAGEAVALDCHGK